MSEWLEVDCRACWSVLMRVVEEGELQEGGRERI